MWTDFNVPPRRSEGTESGGNVVGNEQMGDAPDLS